MKINLKRINDDYHFQLTNDRGHIVELDSRKEFGGSDLASSPMELLLMGIAGCSAIDMISILKKQKQTITDFRAEVEGVREKIDFASPFKKMELIFKIEGEIEPKKAKNAADLSFQKYCSVSKTLEPMVEISYKVFVNNKEVK